MEYNKERYDQMRELVDTEAWYATEYIIAVSYTHLTLPTKASV